jgi:hypothetical protein
MVDAEQTVDELNDRRPGEPQKPLENEVEYLRGFPLDMFNLLAPFDTSDNPRRLSRSGKLYKTRLSLSNISLFVSLPVL